MDPESCSLSKTAPYVASCSTWGSTLYCSPSFPSVRTLLEALTLVLPSFDGTVNSPLRRSSVSLSTLSTVADA